MGLKFIFKEKGGTDTFTISNVDVSNSTKTVTHRVKRNVEYDVKAIATGTHTIRTKPDKPAPSQEKMSNQQIAPIEIET